MTAELSQRITAEMAGGARLDDAARACGISPRTLRGWRRRAWSQRPEDRRFVELERSITAARLRVARPLREPEPDWREAAAALEDNFPQRWALGQRRAASERGIDELLAQIPSVAETLEELEALPSLDELLAGIESLDEVLASLEALPGVDELLADFGPSPD